MKIVTAAEMREIDRITTEKYGVPSLTLMENAGSAVAEFVLKEYPEAKRIGVICGKGNNGGDGFVAARKLHEAGKKVEVLLLADPPELKGDAAAMFKKLPVKAVVAASQEALTSEPALRVFHADLLVDAILGTGFKPPVGELHAAAIREMWMSVRSERPVVAVDLPSGADPDAASMFALSCASAPAHCIVTFTAPKLPQVLDPGLASGPIVVAEIGSPPAAISSALNLQVITARDLEPVLRPRIPDAHKGDFGHVLIIGGAVGRAGAAAMAGMAALRAGAGLVTVAVPRSILPTVAGFAPELMTEPLEETDAGAISLRALEYGKLEALVKGKSAVALGPGISRHPETAEFVRSVVRCCPESPLIVDADGLNAFEGHADKLDGSDREPLVLTPHPGEMARLARISAEEVQKDRIGVARKFAQEHHATVVLKGHRTLIALPDGSVWVNTTGNPGMATGGTGDILTGMAAGMTAQQASPAAALSREVRTLREEIERGPLEPDEEQRRVLEPMMARMREKEKELGAFRPLEALLAAVYLHGLAGDVARERLGEHSMIATDLLTALPEAFVRVRRQAGEKFVRISG
ncbi:MAG: NAD(P)H-hydrate dehydratase [Terriglobales bacterium]